MWVRRHFLSFHEQKQIPQQPNEFKFNIKLMTALLMALLV